MKLENQDHPWLTVEGFLKLYSKHLSQDKPFKAAYEAAEAEFQAKYNHPRYASYETFMKARSQYRKVRQKKEQSARQAA